MPRHERNSLPQLLSRLLAGDRGALSRLLTRVEASPESVAEIGDALEAARKGALRIGITGPPGVGKSTIIDQMVSCYRSQGVSVGVLATDPSSHRSGGALLGDRVRQSLARPDDKVFFRSIGSRGAAGGLSVAVHDQIDLMDAFGFERILIEAVGAGQSEVEISFVADLTLVVLSPEGGDAVQAMKAGLMEVGDIYVINKTDLPGSEQALETLRLALELRESAEPPPRAFPVSALREEGVSALCHAVGERLQELEAVGHLAHRREGQLARRVRQLVLQRLERQLMDQDLVGEVIRRHPASPHRLAAAVVQQLCGQSPSLGGSKD